MKRLFSAALLLALSLPVPALAETADKDIVAESAIKAVTVYTGRAKVTREAVVDVPAGARTVVFKDLPATLLPDSLRAEGKSKASVKFGAVAHKQVMSSQLTSAREKELTEKMETLQDQLSLLNAEKSGLDAQNTFLANLGKQASLRADEDIAEINLKPEQWSAAAEAIQTGTTAAMKAKLQLGLKTRDLEREIRKIRNELSQLRTGGRSTYAVTVPLEADKPARLTIELSYQVPNASWTPLYDARLVTEGKGGLQLTQFGSVTQRTGEDWENVALTLSTAQPQRGASLPDLQPMWVDVYDGKRVFTGNNAITFQKARMMQQNIVSSEMEMAGGAMDMAAPAAAPMEEDVAASFVTAEINTGGFVSEYKIPGPSNVMADGTQTKLMVGDFDIASKIEVHVKPQLSGEAFLVAKSKLKGESPILPGQVNLFRDGAYVGQSSIRLLRPDEDYDFYFGVDDQVSVKRKVLKDERQEEGVITRETVLERHYATEIQNLHTSPVDVVVKETAPAPRNEKITLELLKTATTQGYKDNSDNIKGMLYWQFELAPKEKKELKLGWKLSWPKDHTLTGLQ